MIKREVLDRPDIRLTDLTIGQLILDLGDGTPAYLTGSNVWLRSIFGKTVFCDTGKRRCTPHARQVGCACLDRLDYDIVLSSKESAEAFIVRMLSTLNRRVPQGHEFTRSENAFGNGRIVHSAGDPIIDVWHLETGESIGELLLGYPEAYQRSALHVSHHITAGSLFRIVRADFDIERAARARRESRYPGH